jgi:hypothetical protein
MSLSFTIAAGPRQCSHSQVPSPTGLMTIIFCLRFDTPRTWRARFLYLYPPGRGWPDFIPRHWIPFSLPRATRKATGKYSTSPEYRSPSQTVPLLFCVSRCHQMVIFRHNMYIYNVRYRFYSSIYEHMKMSGTDTRNIL